MKRMLKNSSWIVKMKKKTIDESTALRTESAWKFYQFLHFRLDVYELNSAIGKINELPQQFNNVEESNQYFLNIHQS